MQNQTLPVGMELVATQDRSCVMAMLRAEHAIPLSELPNLLRTFAQKVDDELRLQKTKIAEVKKPQLIV